MKVFRAWIEPEDSTCGVCCILIAAESKERAVPLIRQQVKDFPELIKEMERDNYRLQEFDLSMEQASIC